MKTNGIHMSLVFFLSFGFFAILTHDNVFLAGNDASRFAHIESLGDYSVSYINDSRYNWTVDKVTINGLDYTNKPPLLGIVGAGIYKVLKKVFNISFANNEKLVIYLLTLILIGGTASWLSTEFYLALGMYKEIQTLTRIIVTTALITGTILTTFASTFNNHTVAAALLFASLHRGVKGSATWAGVFAGLTFCVDIVPGLVFIPLLSLIVYDISRVYGLVRFSFSLFMLGILFVAANLWTLGYPLTPKFIPGAFDHSSNFGSNLAGVLLPQRWIYPLECLFGGHGFFSVSPVLIFGVIGLIVGIKKQTPLQKKHSLALAAGSLFFILGHITLAGSYGGWSYGFRYLIPIIPILLFFVPTVLGGWRTVLFVMLLLMSILFAIIGAYNPWPPAYEQEEYKDPIDSMVTNPVGGNLVAWMQEYFPKSSITEKISDIFINSNSILRSRYLMNFYESKGDMEMMKKMSEEINRDNADVNNSKLHSR